MHPARKINLVLSFDYSLAQVLALVMSVWDIRILDFPGILVFPIDPFFLAVILKLFSRSQSAAGKEFLWEIPAQILRFLGSGIMNSLCGHGTVSTEAVSVKMDYKPIHTYIHTNKLCTISNT